MSDTTPIQAGDDPGDLTAAQERAADAAANRWTPGYTAGWDARAADAPRDPARPADWLKGWDDCDAEPE